MSTKAASKKTSTEEVIKPELLPADVGGGEIHFLKRGDYARRTAENFVIKTKADVKRDHVTQMLDALDGGATELDGEDVPDAMKQLFGIVKLDYAAGVDKVREDKAAEEKKKADEEAAAKAKQEKEDKLFQSISAHNPNLGDLAGKFDTGNMDRFIPKADVTDEELLGAFKTGVKLGDFNGWMLGDLGLALEKRGLNNVVNRLCEETGTPYSKVYNDMKTARLFPPTERTPGISFTIFREVANAKFTDDQKKKLPALKAKIAEGKMTTQSVREEVRAIQEKPTPTAPGDVKPEEDTKRKFLVIDTALDEEQQIQITTGFPAELAKEGVIIIDMKAGARFNYLGKKPETRWPALAEYKKPEPTPAADSKGGKKGGKKK